MKPAFLARFLWQFWRHKILNMPSGDRGRGLNINRPESSLKPLPVIVMKMMIWKMLIMEVKMVMIKKMIMMMQGEDEDHGGDGVVWDGNLIK